MCYEVSNYPTKTICMIDHRKMNSLCRICLEEGASIPIFELDTESDKIYSKLSLCLREKLEDVEGFPRNICHVCVETLETVYAFVNKYKESTKILQNGLINVKTENDNLIQLFSDNDLSEVEIEIEAIKTEPNDFDDDDNDCLAELLKPLTNHIKSEHRNLKSKTTKELAKIRANKEITIKKVKSETKNKTNKIASSLLEGEFIWTGDKWCINKKTEKTKEKIHKKIVKSKIPQKTAREVKLKIPKIRKPDPPKLCDLCGEIFKDQEKLTKHKRKVHFKKPVKCPDCPRTLASEHDYLRHRKRRHDNIKNFICSDCGRGFAFQGELTSHNNKVHKKHLQPKKMFTCKVCNKTYKCPKSVIIHERSVHTGLRPAECSICGSRFFHEDYLKEHMRLHTGETPFKCPICGRGYAQRGNMKSHLRIHRLAEIDPETMSKMRPNYLKLLKDFR